MWLFAERVAINEAFGASQNKSIRKKEKQSYCCGFIVISFLERYISRKAFIVALITDSSASFTERFTKRVDIKR